MPIYGYKCSRCGTKTEMLQRIGEKPPVCCDKEMGKEPTYPVMVKITGEGGYPSRRKQIRNTTFRNHPPLEKELNRTHF